MEETNDGRNKENKIKSVQRMSVVSREEKEVTSSYFSPERNDKIFSVIFDSISKAGEKTNVREKPSSTSHSMRRGKTR